MEPPTNPNLDSPPNNSTMAGQDSGEAQFNKPDTIGLLKQQLVKIAKNKHEKLMKDVEGVLQCNNLLFKTPILLESKKPAVCNTLFAA